MKKIIIIALIILLCGCAKKPQLNQSSTTTIKETPLIDPTTTVKKTTSSTTTTLPPTTTTTLRKVMVCNKSFERQEWVYAECNNLLTKREYVRNESEIVVYTLTSKVLEDINDEVAVIEGSICEYKKDIKVAYSQFIVCTINIQRPTLKPFEYVIASSTETAEVELDPRVELSIPKVKACDERWALVRNWGIRCYDDIAIEKANPNLCISKYCQAYVSKDEDICQKDELTCKALAARDFKICNEVYDRRMCKLDYTYVVGDINLCKSVQGPTTSDLCYGDWAYERGDISYCKSEYRRKQDQEDCMNEYFRRIALEKGDKSLCDKVVGATAKNNCVSAVGSESPMPSIQDLEVVKR